MSYICVSISEKGVERVDILYASADDYPQAARFHEFLSSEIAKLDKFVKDTYEVYLEADIH